MSKPERRYPPVNMTVYRTVKLVFRVLYRLFINFHIIDSDKVPREGGLLLLTNHLSLLDSTSVFLATKNRTIHVLAADKYKDNLLIGSLVRVAGAIFINRGEPDRNAIR